ncbi:MAG: redoxin domain-containing protein [bacterium]|nr:redoxin domain-containing protein [bacterium]
MKKVFSLLAIGCLLMASSGFTWPGPGTTAPAFTLPDTASVNHSLSEFAGKVVFLNFWASS